MHRRPVGPSFRLEANTFRDVDFPTAGIESRFEVLHPLLPIRACESLGKPTGTRYPECLPLTASRPRFSLLNLAFWILAWLRRPLSDSAAEFLSDFLFAEPSPLT